MPPWEAALISSSTMSNKERKRQEAAKRQAEAEAARKVRAEALWPVSLLPGSGGAGAELDAGNPVQCSSARFLCGSFLV